MYTLFHDNRNNNMYIQISPLQIWVCKTVYHQHDVKVLWSMALTFSILDTDIHNNYILSPFVDIVKKGKVICDETHTNCPWEGWGYMIFQSTITVGSGVNPTIQKHFLNVYWNLEESSFVNRHVCVMSGVYWTYGERAFIKEVENTPLPQQKMKKSK